MTVRLHVRTAIWRTHVARVASEVDGLVPVVKGNGYGFGRARLADIAAEFADTVAVGTIHELDAVPAATAAIVLTPTLTPIRIPTPSADRVVFTVGRTEHLDALGPRPARVLVKMTSAMRRYGTDDVAGLVEAAHRREHEVVGVSLHLPLAGDDADRIAAIAARLDRIDPALPVWVSHLSPAAYATLPGTHRYRLRLGTSLWLGRRDALHLSADVLDRRRLHAGEAAGYHLGAATNDGHLVMIGAGTAHGVTPLPDGRSPFHFGRQRMPLHEPPHMHTSMALVADGAPLPAVGDLVDVQRPLTMTLVDEIDWR